MYSIFFAFGVYMFSSEKIIDRKNAEIEELKRENDSLIKNQKTNKPHLHF